MDEENKFFGFVSKIGSLINSNKSKETKKRHEKKYNIKISTDDEEDLDNIDNDFDEESEEEEEEKEEKNKEKEEEGNKEIKEEQNTKNNESEQEKEKIQSLVKEIMNSNDNEKKDEEEEKDNDENNINNDNTNNLKKYLCPPILNNSFPVVDNNSENEKNAFVYDDTTSCHVMLKKGNDININDYIVIPVLFMEKQKNIFYKMGMVNKPTYGPKKYLLFFDEHYIYFTKDEIIPEEMDKEIRRISKIISLFDIKDFSNDNDNDKFLIKLLVKREDDKEKEINFYIEQNYFSGFIKNFNLKMSIYGIDFFSSNNNKI